ncbi:MAG: YggS family pyridoxal phosphate-dependent enzyme [Leptospirales bacterium]|nr:YggS family pyridoxal phosphate-dependent enzyme [Leptospirales bacterium]
MSGPKLHALKTRLADLGHADVRLIAVSKTHPAAMVDELIRAGHRDFGENRVNEARDKFSNLDLTGVTPGLEPIFHHIGPLQSGMARQVTALFHFVHGASSHSAIAALAKACAARKVKEPHYPGMHYLIQVDLTGEVSKLGGMNIEELLATPPPSTDTLKFKGLMTMGPSDGDRERTRQVFRELRKIRDTSFPGSELSMGMSGDYEIALEEGSTMIRVGSLIFGSR